MQEASWENLYKAGAVAALLALLVGVIEIGITFLPGGMSEGAMTTLDWFTLLQTNWFMGLRNLGLLNIFLTALAVPIMLALYAAHRQGQPAGATLALITALIGVAVFYATNRAFPMLALSHQYAAATSDARRAAIEAAGQAMLSVGQSHTPGTFLAFLFSELAILLMSLVMLRGQVFGKLTAWVGLVSSACLLVYEVMASFAPGLSGVAMVTVMIGGLLGMLWYILVARQLFRLHRSGAA